MKNRARSSLMEELTNLDRLKVDLFHAAPDDEIAILQRMNHSLQLCRGYTVVDIQNIKMIKSGSD